METTVSVLGEVFEKPQDGSDVSLGEVVLTPADAQRILDDLGFERQRDADLPHARMLADMMKNGEFAAGSQLTFAVLSTDGLRLVDGQHRLRAAIIAQWEGKWNLRVLWAELLHAEGAYVLLDGHQKKRPASVMGRALGLQDLTTRLQGVVVHAAKCANIWRTDYPLPPGLKFPPIRDNIAFVRERLPIFMEVDALLAAGGSDKTRRKMATGNIVALMTETIAGPDGDQAREFWTEVGTNGTGVAGELRDTLIEGRPQKSSPLYIPRSAGDAWNQRAGARLKRSRTSDTVKVTGTTLELPA